MNTLVQRMLIVGFCFLMGLPLTATLLKVGTLTSPEFQEVEMRQRAKFPQWNKVGSVSGWTNQFGLWFNDRYAFRHMLSKSHAFIQYDLFNQSGFPGAVIVGQNDFLFLGNDHGHYIQVHAGIPVWSDEQIAKVAENFRNASDWLGTHDIPLLLSVAPDKATIYGEHLPGWIPAPNRNLPAARLRTQLKEAGQTNFYYNPELLLEAKKQYPDVDLYLSGDTHWNMLGAFVYYQDMMRELEMQYGKPLRVLQDFGYIKQPLIGFCDLERFIKEVHRRDWLAMNAQNWPPKPEKFVTDPVILQQVPQEGFADFLTTNPNALNPQKLLMVGDSFAGRMMEFFYRTFGSILYLHTSTSSEVIAEAVKWYGPDMVIFEIIERSVIIRGLAK